MGFEWQTYTILRPTPEKGALIRGGGRGVRQLLRVVRARANRQCKHVGRMSIRPTGEIDRRCQNLAPVAVRRTLDWRAALGLPRPDCSSAQALNCELRGDEAQLDGEPRLQSGPTVRVKLLIRECGPRAKSRFFRESSDMTFLNTLVIMTCACRFFWGG